MTDRHPVSIVAYADAVAFCSWLSKKEGKIYRLPTEAEWELAARANTTSDHWCGDSPDALTKHAWFEVMQSQPVAKKNANPFGLFDLYGNVWEWTSDGHGSRQAGENVDPMGSENSQWKVLAGGGFADGFTECSSVGRVHQHPRWRSRFIGFRVLRELELPPTPAEILTSHEWRWTEPENLGEPINSPYIERGPQLSSDGLRLIFASDRPLDPNPDYSLR